MYLEGILIKDSSGATITIGQQLAANSFPVILPSATITTLTPPAAITGFALQTTLAEIALDTDNLDITLSTLNTSINTLLKPANTLTALTTLGTITNALPAGTNGIGKLTANSGVTIGAVEIAAAQTLATVSTVTSLSQFAGTAIDVNSGNKGNGTLRVVLATDQPALTNKLLVTPDSVALPANQSVNVSQINGHTTLEGGVNGSQSIGGTVATNVAITANPINLGAQAVSSENSAVTTARQVQLVADLVGKLIVLPYANPENFVLGVTAAIIDTTNTSVIASAGGSLRNYITSILVTNSHATVSTLVEIRDGATTVIWRGYALAAGGGFSITFPVPLRGTAATAVTASCITTGSNVYVSCTGFKGL